MTSTSPPLTGPRGEFLIGCLREFRRDLLGFITRCAREHGDFVLVRVVTHRGFLISDPALVAEVLTRRHQDFRKVFMLRNNRLFLGDGLLTSEKERWRQGRRTAQPAFHPRRMPAYADVMIEEAVGAAERWRDVRVLDVQREMMELTLRVVVRCLFGTRAALDSTAIAGGIETIQSRMQERLNALIPLPDTAWTPRNIRLRRAIRGLDRIVYGLIEQGRAAGATGTDLLSALTRSTDGENGPMTDRQLRDEAMTMFFAGHETTALALSWSWYLLARNPSAESRLHAALDEVLGGRPPVPADLPKLGAVERVVKEALRLYPPVYAFGRDAIRDTVIGGHRVPKGTSAMIAPWVMHRDPRFFPDPDSFRPERWTAEFERNLPRFAYCPFGGGARMCIGKGFAMTEAVLVLATLAQRYRPRLVPGHPVELWPTFTLRARHGLLMTIDPRTGPDGRADPDPPSTDRSPR